MSKRINGEGTVRRRADGRWEARYHDDTMKRHSLFARTQTEAAAKLRRALEGRDKGLAPGSTKETLGTYLRVWLAGAKLTLRPRTHDRYEQIVRLHLIPQLGRIRLARLQPAQIRQMYERLLEEGQSPKSVRNIHGVLHRALTQAYQDGGYGLARNVADLVKPPRVTRPEIQPLSLEESQRVLEVIDGDPWEALYVLAITTGLRLGELSALRWQHVDLARGTLSVAATLEERSGHEARVAPTKTERSRRQIELTAIAVEALGRHRSQQKAKAILPTGFVFTRPDGRPQSSQTVRKRWYALLRKAEIPQVRFHDLRHTAATLMLGRQIHPKLVSEMLGHATIGITLDIYSHAIPAMHQEAARAMDELLRPNSDPRRGQGRGQNGV